MARITAWYFRLATTFIALVQVHVAISQTVHRICHFSHDATIVVYHEDGTNLIARGNGSVTLQDVTCNCLIGKPKVTVFFPEGDKNGSNYSLTSPICSEGISSHSCENMPEDYEHIDPNIVSKVNITGTFTQTAVIECETIMNPNKGSPLIVLIDPAPAACTSSQSPSVASSPSDILVTSTATTKKESLSASITSTVESSPTTAVSSVCTTLTNTLTETVSATNTLIVSASDCMPPSLTVTASAITMLTVSTSEYTSPLPTSEPTVAAAIGLITSATVNFVLIMIIIVLLVILTVAIMIARSNHRRGIEQTSATNPIIIEHKEIHTKV